MAIPTLPTFSAGEILTSDVMNDVSTLGNYQGLFHIKTQTIGSGVSSVTVTGAFSSDFDNYKIIVSGGTATTASSIGFRLGASTTEYYAGLIYIPYTGGLTSATVFNGATYTYAGAAETLGLQVNLEVVNPFLAKVTTITGAYAGNRTGSVGGNVNGFHNIATSYTAFTLVAGAGTFTGGTIRVYGYRNSL
jgi:hypothetical protein